MRKNNGFRSELMKYEDSVGPRSRQLYRKAERRAIKNETRQKIEEAFEDQILEAEELEEMLHDIFGDDLY